MSFRSSDDASGESVVSTPSTVLKRLPLQQTTGGQYRLDLRQAPFRLFNNYLVPISSMEEATDALRAVAESITVLLQSIDQSAGRSVFNLFEIAFECVSHSAVDIRLRRDYFCEWMSCE